MKHFAALGAAVLLFAGIAQGDPIGEQAYYVLDTNSSRTSSLIRSGSFDAEVTAESEAGYETALFYDFDIMFQGRQTGTEMIDVPAEYFTPEFLENLRQTGHYSSDKFKIDHRGFTDTRTLDGTRYTRCDNLHIYDIDTGNSFFHGILALALSSHLGFTPVAGGIENLQVDVLVKEELPVLGAVKIDVSGDYQGLHVKAGGDYTPH